MSMVVYQSLEMDSFVILIASQNVILRLGQSRILIFETTRHFRQVRFDLSCKLMVQ